MSKLPTKQIYMLVIIIVGILSLSVYSTYAIFTYEGSTSNIVSIQTPNSLNVNTNSYEYKQISIDKSSYITTDIDIYNSFNYETCYSIWYKVIGNNKDKISIVEENTSLTTSGTLSNNKSIRVHLVIINQSDEKAIINIGIFSSKYEETCSLNLTSDKSTIKEYYEKISLLTDTVKNTQKTTIDEGYLIYKNISGEFVYEETDKINISKEFTYKNEMFTLKDPIEVEAKDLLKYESTDESSYYTCLDSLECSHLYKINKVRKNTKIELDKEVNYYSLVNYDILKGYLQGENGVKQIDNDYLYYGDNPSNFINYNCQNNKCELWRIVGSYYDESTKENNIKIVRNDSIGTYQYDFKEDEDKNNISSNSWLESKLYKYLITDYSIDKKYMYNYPYQVESLEKLDTFVKDIKQNKIEKEHKEEENDISILSLSDYLNASVCNHDVIKDYTESCFTNNYLNRQSDVNEWTMSIYLDEDKLNNQVFTVGNNIISNKVDELLDVRPVIYLKSKVLVVAGDGTFNNPYVIK